MHVNVLDFILLPLSSRSLCEELDFLAWERRILPERSGNVHCSERQSRLHCAAGPAFWTAAPGFPLTRRTVARHAVQKSFQKSGKILEKLLPNVCSRK